MNLPLIYGSEEVNLCKSVVFLLDFNVYLRPFLFSGLFLLVFDRWETAGLCCLTTVQGSSLAQLRRTARRAVAGSAPEADCFSRSSDGPRGCPARWPEVPLSSS